MSLEEIFKKIVLNTEIHEILMDTIEGKILRKSPYTDFVKFQIDECTKHGVSVLEEGFQVGEAWNGDIIKAPILFLGPCPRYEFDEILPRYHAEKRKLIMPSNTKKETEITLDKAIRFFENRIQKSPGNWKPLNISLRKGEIKAAPYWTMIANNTEILLPDKVQAKDMRMTSREYVREVMKYTVCLDIIPFRSNIPTVKNTVFNKCWNEFTKNILLLSKATVIVLVGALACKVFIKKLKIEDAQKVLESRNIYHMKIGNTDRLIIKADFNLGKIISFEKYFQEQVLEELREAVYNAIYPPKANKEA